MKPLIEIKASHAKRRILGGATKEKPMPFDTVMVVVGVIAMFVVFAVTMLWADYQTRPTNPTLRTKRRPF